MRAPPKPRNKIIHHHRYQTVGKKMVNYYTWCGKYSFNYIEDDIEAKGTPRNPDKNISSDIDVSPPAKQRRKKDRHCKKCLKHKTEYFGLAYMSALGYEVK